MWMSKSYHRAADTLLENINYLRSEEPVVRDAREDLLLALDMVVDKINYYDDGRVSIMNDTPDCFYLAWDESY